VLSDAANDGKVVSQNPVGDGKQTLAPGQTVTINIGQAPPPTTTVPVTPAPTPPPTAAPTTPAPTAAPTTTVSP
jgi:hypothetical protein